MQPGEQFGIDNLKKVVKFACDFTQQITTAMSDGKFQWTDSLGFVDEIAQIPGVVKAFPSIKTEITNLSGPERTELFDYIVKEFDIPNDHVEALIENSLSFALSAVGMYELWRQLKAK